MTTPTMTTNYSFYAIPAAWVLSIAPHAYAMYLQPNADRTQPRMVTQQLEGDQTLDQATKDTIVRAEGAQSNGFENLGLFAAAITAANVGRVNTDTLNTLAGGYLISRALYNVVYISHTTPAMANARSVVWMSGVGIIMGMFVLAGNNLSEAVLGNLAM